MPVEDRIARLLADVREGFERRSDLQDVTLAALARLEAADA